jgi:hypothetical protein
MKQTLPYAGLLIVTFLVGGNVSADETKQEKSAAPIIIANEIPFGESTHVRDAVRDECNLGGKLSGFIQEYGNGYDLNISQSSNTTIDEGKVLRMEITNVQGAGGGAWSGSKSVAVQGKLIENGKEIGTFHGSRHSGGGAFGGFKSTCAIFGRCVKALGKDVARWLKSPTMNASLGDG